MTAELQGRLGCVVLVALAALAGIADAQAPAPPPGCGDGALVAPEECDDGNLAPNDGCAPTCRLPLHALVMGQSNAGNFAATFAVDDPARRVTSPAANGSISTSWRVLYAEAAPSGRAVEVALNDFPCADSQCSGTECTAANRTAAGHPDLSEADGDGTCRCDCGASQSVEAASAWPSMAAAWMAQTGAEVKLVHAALGGSCLTRADGRPAGEPLWSPREPAGGAWVDVDCATRDNGSVSDQRGDLLCASYRAVIESGLFPDVVLFLQGECERAGYGVYEGLTGAAAYAAALHDLVDRNWATLGAKTVVAPTSLRATPGPTFPGDGPDTPVAPESRAFRIHEAQLGVIASNPHACRGPSLDDLEHEADGLHVRGVDVLGRRWAEAIAACLAGLPYDGGARVPRCGDESVDAERGELCDDGDAVASDGCDSVCRLGACDDGLDNDADGFADFPDDPGCRDAASLEMPACQNGIDDDGRAGVDFDGGASALGGVAIAEPDPQCRQPYGKTERPPCGLGAELALALATLAWARGRAAAARGAT